jgi:hypothetical protein
MLVRRLEATPAEPTLGAIRARRDVGGLGAAEALAACLNHAIREAGWERIPVGEMLGDGAAWIGKVADRHVPGVRQPLDDDHRSEPLDAFATLQDPGNPAGAKAWVEQNRGALRMNRVGEVLSALKRRRPWQQAIHDALAQLIGDVARPRTRIRSQDPWPSGLAVGSGAVEGACTPVIQRRFKRAGHALEAAWISPRPGVADRQTPWRFPGLLGQPRTHDPCVAMTYRMKAHPDGSLLSH